jgi:hypothetical protein
MRRVAIRRLLALGCRQHHRLGGEPRARAQQPLKLTARLQLVITPERRDHLLANLVAVAAALHDLQIGASCCASLQGTRWRACRDLRFVLNHLAGLPEIGTFPGLEEAEPELVDAILIEAARFAGR